MLPLPPPWSVPLVAVFTERGLAVAGGALRAVLALRVIAGRVGGWTARVLRWRLVVHFADATGDGSEQACCCRDDQCFKHDDVLLLFVGTLCPIPWGAWVNDAVVHNDGSLMSCRAKYFDV